MTEPNDMSEEPTGDDLLAAEYVVGALAADERIAVAARIDAEPAFARLVDAWEVRLAPLADDYDEVPPPASVKAAIDRALHQEKAVSQSIWQKMWSSLTVWRTLTTAALAALLVVLALPQFQPTPESPQLIAAIGANDSNFQFVALYGREHVRVTHLAGDRKEDQDFELWIIADGDTPRSLGILPDQKTMLEITARRLREKIKAGGVLAVSLEPKGGSPTGAPTGPVVASGTIKEI